MSGEPGDTNNGLIRIKYQSIIYYVLPLHLSATPSRPPPAIIGRMRKVRASNEKHSTYDHSPSCNCGICSVRTDDSCSLFGPRLRLVAFENTTLQGTALLMATGSCNHGTFGSKRPGSAFYPLLDADWSERRTTRPMVTLGRPCLLRCRTVRPCRKGRATLVASFLLYPLVRNVFLYLS
jgi:hypothetical protein